VVGHPPVRDQFFYALPRVSQIRCLTEHSCHDRSVERLDERSTPSSAARRRPSITPEAVQAFICYYVKAALLCEGRVHSNWSVPRLPVVAPRRLREPQYVMKP
jgi:hypothetical protein